LSNSVKYLLDEPEGIKSDFLLFAGEGYFGP